LQGKASYDAANYIYQALAAGGKVGPVGTFFITVLLVFLFGGRV
jgi:hypothetical protein